MYNFRYHLVTIISIFAALALGLLLGVAITGTDLMRNAYNNLAQSLTDQFDTLNNTNKTLTDQLEAEQVFSDELLFNWQEDRLKGRTIVILTRATDASNTLEQDLASSVTQGGGIPVLVRIDPVEGFGLDNEQTITKLKLLMPEVEGEDYEVTLARALSLEWSRMVEPDEFQSVEGWQTDVAQAPPQSALVSFAADYPLTTYLIEQKLITVVTNYASLIENIDTAVASPATANTDSQIDTPATTGSPEGSLRFTATRSAYRLAQQLQLPYGINGIIDAAVYTRPDGTQLRADAVALEVALAFDSLGQTGGLSMLSFEGGDLVPNGNDEGGANPSDAAATGEDTAASNQQDEQSSTGTSATGNPADTTTGVAGEPTWEADPTLSYFALLVQQRDWVDAMQTASEDTELPCVLTQPGTIGRYSVIALLTGAEKGVYGVDRPGNPFFPPIPADKNGKAPFGISI